MNKVGKFLYCIISSLSYCADELLHFGGSSLEGFYFLDVPWIFDLMGSITKMPNNNGKMLVISFLYSATVNQFMCFFTGERKERGI